MRPMSLGAALRHSGKAHIPRPHPALAGLAVRPGGKRNPDPFEPVLLINGLRRRKRVIVETTNGNTHPLGAKFRIPAHRSRAGRTKVKFDRKTTIAETGVSSRCPFDRHVRANIKHCYAERTAGSLLAGFAVTGRYLDRLTRRDNGYLAARASRRSNDHCPAAFLPNRAPAQTSGASGTRKPR